MKSLLLITVLSIGFCYSKAQVTSPTVRQPTVTLKTLPPATATIIRKDTRSLQIQVAQLNDSLSLAKRRLDAILTSMKGDLDSMGEMSEEERLKLQRMMEQYQRAMQTISNLMKKMHETQQSIMSNLKG